MLFYNVLCIALAMAEFPDLGQHCGMDGCQQLDFLPFQCSHCQKVFCLDHRSIVSHGCSIRNPQHSDRNHSDIPREADETNKFIQAAAPAPVCGFDECKTKMTAAGVMCNECGQRFCIEHRHPFDHRCVSLQKECNPSAPSAAPLSKAAQVVEEIKMKSQTAKQGTAGPKPVSSKNAATAAKIALMKLKQTAVGDAKVPQEERLYLRLGLPAGCTWRGAAELQIFFSKTWTVGKCISSAATYGGLKNEISNGGAKQRLRLRVPSGRTCEMDETMRQLEERGDLINGGSSVLIYQ